VDPLLQIKRLAVARRVEFTLKAEQERLADGLSVEDVLESILNANAIKKVLRSRSAHRMRPAERLYVIESPTYSGIWVYTKGTAVKAGRRFFMSSSRRSSPRRPGPCPSCGSHRIVNSAELVRLRVGRRRYSVSLDHEHCLACGERIFGLEASRQMDTLILGRAGRRAA